MGRELVSLDSATPVGGGADVLAPVNYTQIFWEHLPFYMSIGMTMAEYWDGDCCLTKYYRKAQDLRNERLNEQLWIQGAYIYEALCCASPLFRSLAKNAKAVPYRDKPYDFGGSSPVEKATTEKKRYAKNMDIFMAKMAVINRQRKEVNANG